MLKIYFDYFYEHMYIISQNLELSKYFAELGISDLRSY